jgi:hypothetical protein
VIGEIGKHIALLGKKAIILGGKGASKPSKKTSSKALMPIMFTTVLKKFQG